MPETRRLGGEMTPVACHECDLLQLLPELPAGGKASCSRCGCTLATHPADPIERPLALCIGALLVLIVANTAPLMGMCAVGVLILLFPAILSSLDTEELWARVAWHEPDPETGAAADGEATSKQLPDVIGNSEPNILTTPSERCAS